MLLPLRRLAQALIFLGCSLLNVHAQGINPLPKYGTLPKSEAERAADAKLLEAVDRQYEGNRKKASEDAAAWGWRAFRRKQYEEAMRRFNQAWLLDPSNAQALWGMGSVQGTAGRHREALQLFDEAAPALEQDIDFSVDHARTQAMAAVRERDAAALQRALERFAAIHARAPQHTLNLQNWAMALFAKGDLAGAWEKVQWAEATPGRAALDQRFISDLQFAMPRPASGTGSDKPADAVAPSPVQAAAPKEPRPPQLWSGHKLLPVSLEACAEKAHAALTSLGYANVIQKGPFSYGNLKGNRASVKCVEIPSGALVYFAVAGRDRDAVGTLRNDIAKALQGTNDE
ncbi:tetratricopeptide repeat protein [Azohydromonas australica]|uniref:tetratricopeptide repeat protein n=1 Tax=Azohydromonas australica TaxID=364039 RepID=UPI00040F6369|nr:tetratricopeptide repeat protein [Azohydromonas australica]